MTPRRLAVAVLALAAVPRPGAAQGFGDRSAVVGGVEARGVTFARGFPVRSLRQVSLPIGAVVTAGRFSFDLGTTWAWTGLERADGTDHGVSDFTDTQVRAAVVLGRDAAVATVVVNLPTGPQHATARDYTVIGAVSPSLLAFPVPSYANGFSVTSGLAAAIPTGDWSLGLAGSVRASREFTPYEDSAGAITYRPGVEGRIRAGADGLVGSSRLTLGVTLSTFGDDQLGLGTGRSGSYHPGTRWIAEASLVAPVGNTSMSVYAWNFHRAAGDTAGGTTANRENLLAAGVGLAIPAGSAVSLEPAAEWRISNPERGQGWMFGAGLSVRAALGNRLSLVPGARYERGAIRDDGGRRIEVSGWYTSALLRLLL